MGPIGYGLHYYSQLLYIPEWLPMTQIYPIERITASRPTLSLPLFLLCQGAEFTPQPIPTIGRHSRCFCHTQWDKINHMFFANDSILFAGRPERNGLSLKIYSKFISQALAKPFMNRKKWCFLALISW